MSVPDPLITTSPDRLSGTSVFAKTRVPVQTLVDYLEPETLWMIFWRTSRAFPENTPLPC